MATVKRTKESIKRACLKNTNHVVRWHEKWFEMVQDQTTDVVGTTGELLMLSERSEDPTRATRSQDGGALMLGQRACQDRVGATASAAFAKKAITWLILVELKILGSI